MNIVRPSTVSKGVFFVCLVLFAHLLALDACAIAQGKTLVSYSFEDSSLSIDDNALYFFNNAKGHVGYSSEFALSGYRSIELEESSFDQEFTELQGRFPVQTSGVLRFHFAILVENPEEELNIAVAGPEHFHVKKNGMAFWLHTKDGVLIHESGGIPRRLFSLKPFQWYFFDVVYDIDRGSYDIYADSEVEKEVVLRLTDQPNASDSRGSSIDRFSFIGDLGDRSRVHYFIDDVNLSAFPSRAEARQAVEGEVSSHHQKGSRRGRISNPARVTNNALPDRSKEKHRRGYLDAFLELQSMLHAKAQCLPATIPSELGISSEKLSTLIEGQGQGSLEDKIIRAAAAGEPQLARLQAWSRGCVLLRDKRAGEAETLFRRAIGEARDYPLFTSALILALAAQHKYEEAEALLRDLEIHWAMDPRLDVIEAYVHAARGHYGAAKNVLAMIAQQVQAMPDSALLGEFLAGDREGRFIEALRHDFPFDWRKRLDDLFVAQNYYYALLGNHEYQAASEFAGAMVDAYRARRIFSVSWLERKADAAFLNGATSDAKELYLQVLNEKRSTRVVWRKLLDLVHQQGDLNEEIALRKRFAKEFQTSAQ